MTLRSGNITIAALIAVIIIIIIICITKVTDYNRERNQNVSDEMDYLVLTEDVATYDRYPKWVSYNGLLYVYFDEDAVFKVYDDDSHLKTAIQFKKMQNGIGSMAIIDGLTYIKIRYSIIFVVDDNVVVDVIRMPDLTLDPVGYSKFRELEERIDNEYDNFHKYKEKYRIINGKLTNVDNGVAVGNIQARPAYWKWLSVVILFVVMLLLVIYIKLYVK